MPRGDSHGRRYVSAFSFLLSAFPGPCPFRNPKVGVVLGCLGGGPCLVARAMAGGMFQLSAFPGPRPFRNPKVGAVLVVYHVTVLTALADHEDARCTALFVSSWPPFVVGQQPQK